MSVNGGIKAVVPKPLRSLAWQAMERMEQPRKNMAWRAARARRWWSVDVCKGGLAVDICNANLGFFAHLDWVLEILAFGRESGRRVDIKVSSRNYISGEKSFLDALFIDKKPGEEPVKSWKRMSLQEHMGLPKRYNYAFTFESANALLFERYALHPEVIRDVEEHVAGAFGGRQVLGVHYRGTDKVESPRVPYEVALGAIDHELGCLPEMARLFVATDEQKFLETCKQRYGGRVVYLEDHVARSTGFEAIHKRAGADGLLRSKDALLNCLCLARCSAVVKTSSILSAWASVFNPKLKISTLTRRYAAVDHFPFPERDIPDYVPTGARARAAASLVEDRTG